MLMIYDMNYDITGTYLWLSPGGSVVCLCSLHTYVMRVHTMASPRGVTCVSMSGVRMCRSFFQAGRCVVMSSRSS